MENSLNALGRLPGEWIEAVNGGHGAVAMLPTFCLSLLAGEKDCSAAIFYLNVWSHHAKVPLQNLHTDTQLPGDTAELPPKPTLSCRTATVTLFTLSSTVAWVGQMTLSSNHIPFPSGRSEPLVWANTHNTLDWGERGDR